MGKRSRASVAPPAAETNRSRATPQHPVAAPEPPATLPPAPAAVSTAHVRNDAPSVAAAAATTTAAAAPAAAPAIARSSPAGLKRSITAPASAAYTDRTPSRLGPALRVPAAGKHLRPR